MDADSRELLGMAKEDFWYYPCFAMLIGACFLSDPVWVAALFGLSTVLLVIYLVKSTPKYFKDASLSNVVRAIGLAANVLSVAFHVVVIGVKYLFLLS